MQCFLRSACRLAIISCLALTANVSDAGLVFGPEEINFGSSSIVGGGGYPGSNGSSVSFQSGTITAPDGEATFRIGITVTPGATTALSNNGTDVVINSGAGDPSAANINPGESLTFASLAVLDFDSGNGVLTSADITGLQISNITLAAARDSSDSGSFGLNSTLDLVAWDDAGGGDLIAGEGTGSDAGKFNLFQLNGNLPVSSLFVSGTGSMGSQFRVDSIGVSGVTPVPEPSSFLFLGMVGLGYTGFRRYRTSAND